MVGIALHRDVREVADGAGHLTVERQRHVELEIVCGVTIFGHRFLHDHKRGTACEDFTHLGGYLASLFRVLCHGQGEGEGGGIACFGNGIESGVFTQLAVLPFVVPHGVGHVHALFRNLVGRGECPRSHTTVAGGFVAVRIAHTVFHPGREHLLGHDGLFTIQREGLSFKVFIARYAIWQTVLQLIDHHLHLLDVLCGGRAVERTSRTAGSGEVVARVGHGQCDVLCRLDDGLRIAEVLLAATGCQRDRCGQQTGCLENHFLHVVLK